MWTRAELKKKAKTALKPYYWSGVLICIITGLLFGTVGGGFGSGSSASSSASSGAASSASGSSGGFELDSQTLAILGIVLTIFLVILVVAIVLSTFIGNVVTIGKLNFFLSSRYQGSSAGIGILFSNFSGGHYLNVVKIMFLKNLYEFLWGLLLVIPGIYKSYEYRMVPYLLAENPGIDSREAFRKSKQMMDGQKLSTWVLDLSFIGWYLLGGLLCGIGTIFVNPYFEATLVELYLHLNGYTENRPEDIYVYGNYTENTIL